MNEYPTANDWNTSRGDKWLSQVSAMEAMLAPVDGPLIDALCLDAPCRVADVGCGGGGTTRKVAARAPAGSAVHGFDISPALIQLANSRLTPGDENIAFHVADIGKASVPYGIYDRLISRFGVMFFDDPVGAFANLAEWLAVGGRFAFAVWGAPADNPWMTSVREAVGEVIELAPLDLGSPGLFRYGDADEFMVLLRQSGFGELTLQQWCQPLAIGGGLPADKAARFALASFSNFAEQLALAGSGAMEKAQQLLSSRFASHEQDGTVKMDACVNLIAGARLR